MTSHHGTDVAKFSINSLRFDSNVTCMYRKVCVRGIRAIHCLILIHHYENNNTIY